MGEGLKGTSVTTSVLFKPNLKGKYGKILVVVNFEWQEYRCLLDYFYIFYIFSVFKQRILKIQILNLEFLH